MNPPDAGSRGLYRGHSIRCIRGTWFYEDGVRVSDDPYRACGHCGLPSTPEGHDGCLGTLEGVVNACCGHGQVREAYVVLVDGTRLSGEDSFSTMARALLSFVFRRRPKR